MNSIFANWQKPFHRERRPKADLQGRHVGTACGDEIDVYLFVENGVVRDAYFEGDACTICLGIASLLTRHIIGLAVEDLRGLTADDVFQLAPDVEIPMGRHGCALTALLALLQATRPRNGR